MIGRVLLYVATRYRPPPWGKFRLLSRLLLEVFTLSVSETQRLQGVYRGIKMGWCPEVESNHRHEDFQSSALPTELSGHKTTERTLKTRGY